MKDGGSYRGRLTTRLQEITEPTARLTGTPGHRNTQPSHRGLAVP
uniref:Uncharacterized protein n=1 Tax=Anguilla anguilla TaxID=7936 RepID=A0A0E9TS18_ANGAN